MGGFFLQKAQTAMQKPKKQQKQRTDRKEHTTSRWLCLLRGLAVSFAITCILFIGFGILLTYTALSEETLPMVSLGCTALSTAAAGFDWGSCMGQKGLLWGALAGVVYTLLLLVLTGLAGSELQLTLSALMTLIVAMAGGSIGGILGVNHQS